MSDNGKIELEETGVPQPLQSSSFRREHAAPESASTRRRKYISMRGEQNPLMASLGIFFPALVAKKAHEPPILQNEDSQQAIDGRAAPTGGREIAAEQNPASFSREGAEGPSQPSDSSPKREITSPPDTSSKVAHPPGEDLTINPVSGIAPLRQPPAGLRSFDRHDQLSALPGPADSPFIAGARSNSPTLITSKLTHHQSTGHIAEVRRPAVLKRYRKQHGTGPVEYTLSMKSRRA